MADPIPGVVSPEQGQGPAQDPAQAAATGPMQPPAGPASIPASQAPPAAPQQDTGMPAVGAGAPQQPAKPGSFFNNLSHAFMGAVLGGLAGKQDVDHYEIDPNTGVQKPVLRDLHPRDQLAKIAGAALRGLAAGSASQGAPGDIGGAAFGAGGMEEQQRAQQQDLLKRQQSQEQFETEQKATFNKLSNAHILMQTVQLRNNLANADLETNQRAADLGSDTLQAATAGGNQTIGPANMTSDEVVKFRQDHPDYVKYMPLVTRVQLQTDDSGQPIIDPTTGVQKVQRLYTFVDLQKPIKLSDTMINHLQKVGYAGADKLAPGTEVDPQTFQALYWNGLKRYNEAATDPKNIELKEANVNGVNTWMSYNKMTGDNHIVTDAKTGQPMVGKLPDTSLVDQVFTKGIADGKYTNDANGRIHAATDVSKAQELGRLQGDQVLVGDGTKLPVGFQPIPESFSMNEQDLTTALHAKGVTLPSNFSTLYAVGHYDQDPKTFTKTLRKGMPQTTEDQAITLIRQFINPNYQDTNYDAVKKMKVEFADLSQNKPGGNLLAFNTATRHLGDLYDAADALQNNNLQILNKIAQEYNVQTNQPAPVMFNAIRNALIGEIGKTLQGGAVQVDEAKRIEDTINNAQSPDVAKNVAKQYAKIMLDKAQESAAAYHSYTNDYPPNLISPTAGQVYTRLGIDTGGIKSGANVSGGAPAQKATGIPGLPPGAIAARDGNKNIVGYALNGQYVALPTPIPAPKGAQ